MRVALCQMNVGWLDVAGNLLKIKGMVEEAKYQGAELIVFPEMCLTGFSMDPWQAALEPDSPPLKDLLDLTQGTSALVIAGIAVGRKEGTFNEAWVLRDGNLAGVYQKMNLFTFSGEHAAYRQGKSILIAGEKAAPLVPFICYDLRFSELFLEVAEQASAFVVIANWPSSRREQWRALLRARALDTQAYVIGVNRVGSGDGIDYSGESTVMDPTGQQLMEPTTTEGVIVVDVDLSLVPGLRARFPILADRRRLAGRLTDVTIEDRTWPD